MPFSADIPWWDIRAYDYRLPAGLIAQQPAQERDASRLLVYDRASGSIAHRSFRDLPLLLEPGDVLVVNDCRVIPARLYAHRLGTGTAIELLLTKQTGPVSWEAMVKPGRSCKQGVTLVIAMPSGSPIESTVRAVLPDGQRTLEFNCTPAAFSAMLDQCGVVPLPPYIARPHEPSNELDRARYQTVYARAGQAVAAPTAGLHFTPGLLDRIRTRGCSIAAVTLDVGIGTFQPVKVDDLRTHVMHAENAELSADTAAELNRARHAGRRIVAVGTTALRTLETSLDPAGVFQPFRGSTGIFIHPPMALRSINGLITNFHLPRSTLLMLVAAWIGTNAWRTVYNEAIGKRYRFYSYGDAMLAL